MKFRTLPVKRRPAPKGVFKRLSAVTGSRKQHVAATAEMENDDGSSKISRALTIIFLIHIVAIGLIFVHQRFLDGRKPDEPKTAKTAQQQAVPALASAPRRTDLPRLAAGEKPYIVRQGDNYARIAAAAAVDEKDLRLINQHAEIVPGLLLKIPPKRIVAVEAAEVTALRGETRSANAGGLVEALPVEVKGASRAQLVRPTINHGTNASGSTSGKSYVVQSGDSVWGIANRFKVNQVALMKANGISDGRKIKVGMNLKIPH